MASKTEWTTAVLKLAIVALTLVAFAATPAAAQAPQITPPGKQKKLPQPPAKLPRVIGDKAKNLDFLMRRYQPSPMGGPQREHE